MTTPAIDASSSLRGTFSTTIGFKGKPPFNHSVTDPGGIVSSLRKYRPESGNAPRLGGFLLCREWRHFGWNITFPADRAEFFYPSDNTVWLYQGDIADPKVGEFLFVPELASLNVQNRVLVKALENLKDQKVHLGNFIAEADKTIKMTVTYLQKLAMGVRRFRKIHPRLWPIVKALEGNLPRWRWCEIPSEWLQLQYGLKPLLVDLYGLYHELARLSRESIPFVTVQAQHIERGEETRLLRLHSGGSLAVHCKMKQVTKVKLVYQLRNPVLAELSTLGLINPLEVVYEQLPYSFLLDWVLPVGSWLSALTADVGWSFVTGTFTLVSESVPAGSRFVEAGVPGQQVTVAPNVLPRGKFFNFQRGCYSTSPVPGFYVKNPLSVHHLANALSLAVQAFR